MSQNSTPSPHPAPCGDEAMPQDYDCSIVDSYPPNRQPTEAERIVYGFVLMDPDNDND